MTVTARASKHKRTPKERLLLGGPVLRDGHRTFDQFLGYNYYTTPYIVYARGGRISQTFTCQNERYIELEGDCREERQKSQSTRYSIAAGGLEK